MTAMALGEARTPLSRSDRLRALTRTMHEELDAAIIAKRPFADRDRYARFLDLQYGFHSAVDVLYTTPEILAALPEAQSRRRLDAVVADLADLGRSPPKLAEPPSPATDFPSALGWLYVVEGSNLGAAFLLKEAEKLGLSSSFGARHLAPAPEGRGLHWRTFKAVLDRPSLNEAEEARLDSGAQSAFRLVRTMVDPAFGGI
jgi:heme oxygenase